MSQNFQDPPTMSRRERERLARRRAMLAAAREVFAEHGFVRATLDEVALRAEFGKGTLYNYFPDGKEELLRAVLDELFEEMDALMQPMIEASVKTTEAFRAALEGYLSRSVRYFVHNQNLFRLLMREAWRLRLSTIEERREYLQAQMARNVSALTTVIECAIDAGALRPLPAASLAQVILVSVPNYVAGFEADGWPADTEAASEEAAAFLTSLLMDGMAP